MVMAAVHEQVNEGAGQKQEVWKCTEDVGIVFLPEKEGGNDQKCARTQPDRNAESFSSAEGTMLRVVRDVIHSWSHMLNARRTLVVVLVLVFSVGAMRVFVRPRNVGAIPLTVDTLRL